MSSSSGFERVDGLGSEQRRDALSKRAPTELRQPDQEEPLMRSLRILPLVRKIEILVTRNRPAA